MSELFYILNNDPEKKNLYTNGFNLTTDIENEEIVIKENLINNKHKGFAGFLIEWTNTNAKKIDDTKYRIIINDTHEFESLIISKMKILNAYYGEKYTGVNSGKTGLKNKNIIEQFLLLNSLMDIYMFDFSMEIASQWFLIVTNFIYWKKYDFSFHDITEERKRIVLDRILFTLNVIHKNYFRVDECGEKLSYIDLWAYMK